jgi:hypoxanthine phosphoribosyltransferase
MSILKNERVSELFSKKAIEDKVAEIGKAITERYLNSDEPVVLIGVLKGSIIFLADLCRAIDLPIELEMMGVSSYGEATLSSGVVRITQDLTRPIKGKHVIIVEDILDTGLTLKYLIDNLEARDPKSISVCTLLRKATKNQISVPVDYVGFDIPNEFVVGYGLDLAERLRNLPMIGIYHPL